MFSVKKHIANTITSIGIVFGILACYLVITQPSWLSAEILILSALITDALDGLAARKYGSTPLGPYLDDIADFINFWLHPGLWIWSITGSLSLAGLFICAIFYRLMRFTLQKQDNQFTFSGLPSPAAALAIMGIIMVNPEQMVLLVCLGLIPLLTISHVPCIHVMKIPISPLFKSFVLGCCLVLPWVYGGDVWALWLAQCVIILSYVLVSIIVLIPEYVLR